MNWHRRLRERRAAVRAARMIVALGALSEERARPRRSRRASLGARAG
jgi:hypothetical protein